MIVVSVQNRANSRKHAVFSRWGLNSDCTTMEKGMPENMAIQMIGIDHSKAVIDVRTIFHLRRKKVQKRFRF